MSVVYSHSNEIPKMFAVDVKERQDRLPTMYWLPKLHKRPYTARFIANSSSCTTTELSEHKKYDLWSCQKVADALIYLLDNIYIRFGSKLYRQNVGIPMGTNFAPLVADLFLFCYDGESLTKEKRYDLIDAFNSISKYLDDLLSIDNIHFEHMVHSRYPAEIQLNKANTSDTEAAFLDLNLSIHNDIVSTKIYDKPDDFNFEIVNFPFLDGDVPHRPSYGVYISQLNRFARASSHVTAFNNRNNFLIAKLLKQGYRYHKLRKAFSKFYRRDFELIEKYHVSLKKTYATRYLQSRILWRFGI